MLSWAMDLPPQAVQHAYLVHDALSSNFIQLEKVTFFPSWNFSQFSGFPILAEWKFFQPEGKIGKPQNCKTFQVKQKLCF